MWSSADPVDQLALALLDRLEALEHRLLVWSHTDGYFERSELTEVAEDVISSAGECEEAQTVIDRLRDRALLYELNASGETVFRTRFAEAIRLFASLRQLFGEGDWATAPRLVADYRLNIRPRRYPARNQSIQDLLAEVTARRPLKPLEREILRALSSREGEALLLARFQTEAAALLLGDSGGQTQGTIICAGTGTGKTLAFYLPCLAKVAGKLSSDAWVQALAIYPRNELLKDQFSEACGFIRKIKSTVRSAKGRGIRIGAFFGLTPHTASEDSLVRAGWTKQSNGYICPYLRCPQCERDLLWRAADVSAGVERLFCSACSVEVPADEVLLTRRSLQNTPPDLLFTTTEMLNRHMSTHGCRELLGVDRGRQRAPHMMLLDEVHTYRGTHGAHVAHLLRRWRHAVRYPVHFVGLSATLSDPQGFMAQMIGVSGGAITPVFAATDMEDEGREYNLVLRGDPVSGTSLLSTTIQSAMLLARVLDPPRGGRSEHAFGRKVFMFTDDLDVTNRLYHNLLDAEGRDSAGREKPNKQPLAYYRGQRFAYDTERSREGQVWSLCDWVGHAVDSPPERLRVGRVSSQDTGVGAVDQVIVATSSLEVGYNDPAVGAIVQHKAPRDPASFLQRKGRAGRLRVTRPWTVVVLSDYGRDRLSYQAYEHMLSPMLESPALPTRNRYILRIQAIYSFMEWVAAKMPSGLAGGTVWSDFTRPAGSSEQRARQEWEGGLVRSVLLDPDLRAELALHLAQALRLTDDEVTALLWEPPRALLTAALPTLLRRLSTQWRRVPSPGEAAAPAATDYHKANTPLPDFVPENLFSDLNVPEVRILTERHGDAPPDEASMPIAQALRTFPPGRVTRRFGVHHIRAAHWIAPTGLSDRFQDLAVEDYCQEFEDIGAFDAVVGGVGAQLRCVRPWTLAATMCPSTVKNTSNAMPVWHSQLCPPERGEEADLPDGSPVTSALRQVLFFTHNGGSPARVRRFASGAEAELRLSDGQERALMVRFVSRGSGERAAVGFEHEVDGVMFRCHISEEMIRRSTRGEAIRACRTAYFRDRVEVDPVLRERGNRFRLEWLGQVYLSVLLALAMERRLGLSEAVAELEVIDWGPLVRRALDRVFQVIDTPEDDEHSGTDSASTRSRVHDALKELLAEEVVQERLVALSRVLWEAPGAGFEEWFHQRLRATLGAALLEACYQLVPQFEAGDLLLDIESGPRPFGAPSLPVPDSDGAEGEIWITESVIGGTGIVEEIRRRYAEDPRRFFLLAEMALAASHLETVDRELSRLLRVTRDAPDLQSTFQAVRTSGSNQEARDAQDALRRTLRLHHVQVSHPVVTALNARILRPGSSLAIDDIVRSALERWNAEENRLGVEIDSRVFCLLAAEDPQTRTALDTALSLGGIPDDPSGMKAYARLYALLWPRGSTARERTLVSYNPFAYLPKVDPLMLEQALGVGLVSVRFGSDNWQVALQEALSQHGAAILLGDRSQNAELAGSLLSIVASPVEAGYLYLCPYVARTQATGDDVAITFHLREAVQ